jgi:hypothetical protein
VAEVAEQLVAAQPPRKLAAAVWWASSHSHLK